MRTPPCALADDWLKHGAVFGLEGEVPRFEGMTGDVEPIPKLNRSKSHDRPH
ncbi:MAG: hypothetical protein ACE37E_06740 [Hyphomicrobiales bacterium]